MEVKLKDLKLVYEEEISKNVKNKKKVFQFERNKIEYLIDIKKVLENNLYDGGKYNIFLIYKPKIRVVMSQSIYDKIINHYVTRFILIPKLSKYLNDSNCATRKGKGTSYAIKLLKKEIEYAKKYSDMYFLKLDIKKYFYNIDHQVLLELIKDDLTNEEYNLITNILNSTNKKYINKVIDNLERKCNKELPRYKYGKGLPIGNMTSQFLAILYLAKLQHYIRHNLHLRFVNYMDDYIIIHHNKEYLLQCLEDIKKIIYNEYKLEINDKKTYIINAKYGIPFLGYNFILKEKKTIIKLSSQSKKNIKQGIKKNKIFI